MEKLAVIETFSHGVRLSKVSPQLTPCINDFCRQMAHYRLERNQQGSWVNTLFKIYGVINKLNRSVLLHRNMWDDLWERLRKHGYSEDNFDMREYMVEAGPDIDLDMQDWFIPREDQVPILGYLGEPVASRTLEVQTGKGKSALACKGIVDDGGRGAFVVLPRYIDKWMADIGKYMKVKPDDVLLVNTAKALGQVMAHAQQGSLGDFKIVLFSLTTLDIWLKLYESVDADTYPYPYSPQEFMQVIGMRTLVFDEVHQSAHQVFNCIIHFHVMKQIYLSATLKSDDAFIMRMYNVAFPIVDRYKTPEWDKYIDVVALEYGIADAQKIKTSYRRREYSHAAFEDSIRRNRKLYKQYMELIWSVVLNDYLRIRQPGMKMLIFCAKVETCETIVAYVKRKLAKHGFPELTVSKYVAEDQYSVLLESDITASTLGSSGTAVDIPDLVVVLMTTNISAIAANHQAVGRLRKILKPEWSGVPLRFLYTYCRDIPKQVDYHMKKIRDLEGIVKSHTTQVSTVVLDVNRD